MFAHFFIKQFFFLFLHNRTRKPTVHWEGWIIAPNDMQSYVRPEGHDKDSNMYVKANIRLKN